MGPPEMRLTPSPWTKDLHHSGWIGRPSRAFPPVNPYVMVSHHTAFIILLPPEKAPTDPSGAVEAGSSGVGPRHPLPGPARLIPLTRQEVLGRGPPRGASERVRPLGGSGPRVLGPLGTRLGSLRTRLGSLRTRLGSLRTRLGHPRARPSFKDLRHMQVSLLSERGMGPYPSDYSRAFAFCTILYPPVYAPCCQGTSPARPLGQGGQPTGLPSSGCDTWGVSPPVPLGPYSTPGEWMPEWHGQ